METLLYSVVATCVGSYLGARLAIWTYEWQLRREDARWDARVKEDEERRGSCGEGTLKP